MIEEDAVELARERDRRIQQFINSVCRRAGGQNDDPPPEWVDAAAKEAGLYLTMGMKAP